MIRNEIGAMLDRTIHRDMAPIDAALDVLGVHDETEREPLRAGLLDLIMRYETRQIARPHTKKIGAAIRSISAATGRIEAGLAVLLDAKLTAASDDDDLHRRRTFHAVVDVLEQAFGERVPQPGRLYSPLLGSFGRASVELAAESVRFERAEFRANTRPPEKAFVDIIGDLAVIFHAHRGNVPRAPDESDKSGDYRNAFSSFVAAFWPATGERDAPSNKRLRAALSRCPDYGSGEP